MAISDAVPREPDQVLGAVAEIGHSVRAARLRRRMTAGDLAGRVGISLPTVRTLETGEPGVSWGIVATTPWVLGLLDPVREALRPENDGIAAALGVGRLPKRVKRRNELDLDDF